MRDRRCSWCGLRASFMGFRANGQFLCPGCHAAVDRSPEAAKGTTGQGPVPVVLPKGPPEKVSKQKTQHITLPQGPPMAARGGGEARRPAGAGLGPPRPWVPPAGATPSAGPIAVSPVPFSIGGKPSAAAPGEPARAMMPPPGEAGEPVVPMVSVKPVSDVVEGMRPPSAPASPGPVTGGAGRGPFASATRRPPGPTVAEATPIPGKEYTKFLPGAQAPDEVVVAEKKLGWAVPAGATGPPAIPAAPETKAAPEKRPAEPAASAEDRKQPAKPKGFPWMIPPAASMQAKAPPPAPSAPRAVSPAPKVASPAPPPKATLPPPRVSQPAGLPAAFKTEAPGAVAKKRTDVIPSLVGTNEGSGPEAEPEAALASPVAPEPKPEATTPAEAAESIGEPARDEAAEERKAEGTREEGGATPQEPEARPVAAEPADAVEASGEAAAGDVPREEASEGKAEGAAATVEEASEAESGPPPEPSWLEAFSAAVVRAAKVSVPPAEGGAGERGGARALEEPAKDAVAATVEAQEPPEVAGEPEAGEGGEASGAALEPELAGEDSGDAAEAEPLAVEATGAEAEEAPVRSAEDEEVASVAPVAKGGEGSTVEESEEKTELSAVVARAAEEVSSGLVEAPEGPVFRPAPPEAGNVGAAVGPGAFGPSTLAAPVAVPVVGSRTVAPPPLPRFPAVAPAPALSGAPPELSAKAMRLVSVTAGVTGRETNRGPLGAARDWIEDHLPLLLVSGLLFAVGVTVFALWRSAENKVITQAGFRSPADFETFQKAMTLVKEGDVRQALDAVRAPATRASADPGLRSFYLELRAMLGEAPATPGEIGELLQSRAGDEATAARVLGWEAAWHHPDIGGRMRAIRALTQLGPAHRIPLAEREIRKALGESAEAALGARPAGLEGYRWDERFVRWHHLRAVTGDNEARERLLGWVNDGQAERIRREAASLALLEIDEPDAQKIVQEVWGEQMRIESINFRVTTSRALGIDSGKLSPEEVRRIRDWATKELGYSMAHAFGLLYEHGIPAGLELLETTARDDGVYGFPAMAAVAELNRVLGGKALGRMAAIRQYWSAELAKLKADPKEAASDVGQTFQKVIGRIIEAVSIEMARAGDGEVAKEVAAGLEAESDFDKVQAALKLGERGLELAMPMLVDIAKGAEKPAASQQERLEARRVLLEQGRGPAKEYLQTLLVDSEAATRFDAACRLLELQIEARPKAVPASELEPPKAE